MRDALPPLGRFVGDELTLDFVISPQEFTAKLNDPAVYLVQTLESETAMNLLGRGFLPLAAVSVLGSAEDRMCLYVPAGSPVKQKSGLKGKKVMGYPNMIAYFMMREDLGVFPDDLFRLYLPSKSGQDALYALSLGQVDAVLSTKSNVGFLKISNPGPLKKIRQLSCLGTANPIPPIMIKSSYPREKREKMLGYLKNFKNNPALKRFLPLANLIKLQFVDPDPKHFDPVRNLMEKGKRSGWDKAYQKWLRIVQRGVR